MKSLRMGSGFGDLEKNLEKLIDNESLLEKKIVLYEASNPSAKMIEVLKKHNITDFIVVDEDKEREGLDFFGTEVKAFDFLKDFDSKYMVLIATHKMDKVIKILSGWGYEKNVHYNDVIDYPRVVKELEGAVPAECVLSLDDIKMESFKILQYIKKVCQENHLQYFLSDGTLLGAVRHKGFIPWDDDIDIMVPFSDYDKLLDIVRKDGKYYVLDPREEPLFRWGYSQILNPDIKRQSLGYPIMNTTALGVDVFPFYSLPDDRNVANQLIQKSHELKKIVRNSCTLYDLDKTYLNAKKDIQMMWEEVGYYDTEFVSKHYDGVLNEAEEKFCYRQSAFADSVDVEFCNEMFSAPIGYDHYLTTYFGNYMQLPPVEKQIPAHNCFYYYV